MQKQPKDQLLADLEADRKDVRHRAALDLAAMGEPAAFSILKTEIMNPPRANDPDIDLFEEAMDAVKRYLQAFADQLAATDLKDLAHIEDVFKDVIFYLEDDPLYDMGHDFIHADYTGIRELAAEALKRRGPAQTD